ncbi:hypothetical protein BHF71_09210 [Vulcanibacillus modesticaldus]|uniref:Uncharacterized protein n=1 Tax=Vulcanibacillus modesticaldus TaxID=337097 RepID=A0A1D2YUF5_9BACI|nr:hypothetical protein BHF71_09210 [Vulcanibacillus modesticaldus]
MEDAIYNWLQIAVVFEARPDDLAAKETMDIFRGMLSTKFQISSIRYERDPLMYTVIYEKDGKEEKKTFDRNLVEKLISDIENNLLTVGLNTEK